MKNKVFGLALTVLMASFGVSEAADPRVVSVGGGLTEIIFALGAENTLVGDDTTSTFPAGAEKLPKVGYARALSAEGVIALKPDLLITTSEAGPRTVLKQLDEAGVKRLELPAARSVDDVKSDIGKIAAELDKVEEGKALIARLDSQLQALETAKAKITDRSRVMFILSNGSGAPMVAGSGSAADSMISLAGAENAAHAFHGYKPFTPEAAAELKPDVILVTDTMLREAGGIEGVLKTPGMAMTPAGANKRVVSMDTMLLLGFGPRTVTAAQELLKAVAGP